MNEIYSIVNRICTAWETVETMKAQNELDLGLQNTFCAIGAFAICLFLIAAFMGCFAWFVNWVRTR